ncbi:RDD family protein [Psychrobium sp. MM17-31]|uniref:RDD family protein n=1 Tax=Psychrobium sp. MM17-31 TaxID=2917758 RepID=UPI001EF4B722|nr:RDD family protein [Psychrobium sp. MM17-31]MCG7531751.1 RDD family protein [Psychrobium sp. MM17-31]
MNKDNEIDFSTYSLAELYDAQRNIDREQYPDRGAKIDSLIKKREAVDAEDSNQKADGTLASRGDRFVAALIDGLIGVGVSLPLFIYWGLETLNSLTIGQQALGFVYGLTTFLIIQGYLIHHYGQTIGKKLVGIRIENLDGTKASLSTVFLKRILILHVISLIPFIGQLIVGIVNPLFIFGKERRCLHDYIAGTKVSNFQN